METITFTIPLTIESVAFINQALAGAKLAGFDTAEYEAQIQLYELAHEIARKQTELEDLQNMLGELTNGS
mgnify:FL=1